MTHQQEFEHRYRAFKPRLIGFFRKRGFDLDTCEDLTQTTFKQYLENHHRGEAGFDTYIFLIARTVVANHIRYLHAGKRRGEEHSLDDDQGEWTDPSAADNPLLHLLEKEKAGRLKELLPRLSPKKRACIKLRLDGMGYPQIARIMKSREETVKSHISQGSRDLQTLLEKP